MRMHTATLAAALAFAGAALAADTDAPRHQLPPSKSGDLVVGMCDGKTSVEVPGVKPGQKLSAAQSRAVADELMVEWRKKNPDARWDDATVVAAAAEAASPAPPPQSSAKGQELEKSRKAAGPEHKDLLPPAPTAPAPSPVRLNEQGASTGATQVKPGAQTAIQAGHAYGAYSERDVQLWNASTQQFVEEGSHIFHDAERLGGTVGISCDMCHPNAANTHPETYPKFQVQLGKVALLRDMINWCIENPVRGKPMHDDDPRLKALEAYILSQRKGVPLEYGKH